MDQSPDTLIANKFLRNLVKNFDNDTGYVAMKKKKKQEQEALNNRQKELGSPPPASKIKVYTTAIFYFTIWSHIKITFKMFYLNS